MASPLWTPDPVRLANSRMRRFLDTQGFPDLAGRGPRTGRCADIASLSKRNPHVYYVRRMSDFTEEAQKPNLGAQTLARGLKVLTLLVNATSPQRPAEIARTLNLERNAVYRLLRELESNSFVAREEESGRYGIGSGLVALSARVMRSVDLRRSARPFIEQLGQASGETVSIHVRHGRRRICIDTVPGRHTVSRVVEIGETLPLNAGPTGKVMLAFVEPAEMASIVEEAIEDEAERVKMYALLERVRTDGYLATVGDRNPGVGGLSAPFFNADGIAGAITVSGPASRWTEESQLEFVPQVVEASAQLSAALGYRSD